MLILPATTSSLQVLVNQTGARPEPERRALGYGQRSSLRPKVRLMQPPLYFFRASWRRAVFLAMTILCAVAGAVCFAYGKAPDVDVASIRNPPELNVEVSDPRAVVTLEVDVTPDVTLPASLANSRLNGVPARDLNARVMLTVTPPTPGEDVHWLLETLADSTWPHVTGYQSDGKTTFHESLDVGSTATDAAGYVGSFVAGRVTKRSRGVFAANLPPIGTLDYLLSTDTHPTTQLQRAPVAPKSLPPADKKFVFSPLVETVVNPDIGRGIPQKIPNGVTRNYFIPATVHSSEVLDTDLGGSQVEEASPSNVEVAAEVTWSGGAGLSPNILTSNPHSADERETLIFFAGALLATGAAALIAFIQERGSPEAASSKGAASSDQALDAPEMGSAEAGSN